MKEEALTYEKAYEELQQIIAEIESGEISVDLLSEKVKRAAALIQICKNKLTSTAVSYTHLDVYKRQTQ